PAQPAHEPVHGQRRDRVPEPRPAEIAHPPDARRAARVFLYPAEDGIRDWPGHPPRSTRRAGQLSRLRVDRVSNHRRPESPPRSPPDRQPDARSQTARIPPCSPRVEHGSNYHAAPRIPLARTAGPSPGEKNPAPTQPRASPARNLAQWRRRPFADPEVVPAHPHVCPSSRRASRREIGGAPSRAML